MLVPILVICLMAMAQGSEDIPGLTMPYDEFLATDGLGYKDAAKCDELAKIVKSRYRKPGQKSVPSTEDRHIADILLTLAEWQHLEESTRNVTKSKRKIVDFEDNPSRKWDLIVYYGIQNIYSSAQVNVILESMALWEKETCIRFRPVFSGFTGRYLYFGHGSTCSSYIGKTGTSGPQKINLDIDGCVDIRVVPHEIGHALGFWHEQSRLDRDDYVDLFEDHIDVNSINFRIGDDVGRNQDQRIINRVPYDFSSMMQYGLKWLATPAGSYGMFPKDPLFIGNPIGHNPRMTFFDAKTANKAYCKDVCPAEPLHCANAGYEDPNNCGSCRCLEGYKGKHCDDIDPGNSGHLPGCPRAGRILIAPGSGIQCIDVALTRSTSGYMECNWYIQTPQDLTHRIHTIDFWFTLLCLPANADKACIDYAEVKYRHLGARGPRFCGTSPPAALNSPTNFQTSDNGLIAYGSPDIMLNFASRQSYSPKFNFCFRTTPRCVVDPRGAVISSFKADDQLDKNVKTTMVARGADNDPCKTRVVARSDGKGDLVWSAVNFGIHPNYGKDPKFADKFHKNYAFNLHGKPGAWERGAKLKNDPVLMTFPYPGWNDGSVFVKVEPIGLLGHWWRVEATCLGKLLFEYMFNEDYKYMEIKLGDYDDWTGKCF